VTAGDAHDSGLPSSGSALPGGPPAPPPAQASAPPPAGGTPAPGGTPPAESAQPAESAESAESTPAGPAPSAEPVLALHDATKSFGAVHAVTDGTIDLYAGEAHALVGENGAGKSTMVKMLAGVHQPDSGELLIDGTPVSLHNPADAQNAGIAVIYQEPTLFPDLSVAENIFMGRQPLLAGRRIDRRRMHADSAALFSRLGVKLDPGRISRGLSIADQQIVEIAKALSLNARVIVMDEPTAALSATEVARLFDVVRTLRSGGAAVLFISHRLEEVFEICQRVTVMRDGRHVLTSELAGLTADDLVRAMVGRQMEERVAGERGVAGDVVLHVEHLTREGVFTDISLDVRAGEIVALAGLVGSGRSEVARAVFGIDRYDAGRVVLRGRQLRRASPTGAMAAGIGFVPEDRRQQGLVMDMSIQQNVALASLARLRKGGLVRSAAERAFAADWAVRLNLKYGRLIDPVSRLSGGNQQKVVLAKWLGRQPTLLIVDEPTRGIDIATKAEVHRLLVRLARDGVAILMISSELPEVLQIGDRILVMREGRLTAEFGHEDASEEKIMAAATGQLQEAS
jgi:rhamnose transport system ATP-binding protein